MELFSPPTRRWFEGAFAEPTRVQRQGWPELARGAHSLLLAPTGSGKTLAAFLWAIDRLSRLEPEAPAGVRVLYVSPLKALVYDIERNLRSPLVGIARAAVQLGESVRGVGVDVRTGDTSSQERRRQKRRPADILVTTPESLFLILGSQAAETLRTVETVIVDEIHAVAPSKRGAHLALSLERLSERCAADPQRVGLSATVRPAEEAARFLGGERPVEIVDASEPAHVDLEVVVPVPDMENIPEPIAAGERRGGSILAELAAAEHKQPSGWRGPETSGIWPSIYPRLLDLVRSHRSTIIFTNSRSLCERLAQRLNELAGEEGLVRAHHGSISHQQRAEIEEALKAGTLGGIVATSSLELGVDMGSVDLVVLVESPGSVGRGLQRVGRAGHAVGERSLGVLFPKFRGDLLECAVVAEGMTAGVLEPIRVPRNALDVLAQQLVALLGGESRTVEEIHRLVRRAYPYQELSRDALVSVLDMLSGRYPSAELADLRPRLNWNRAEDRLSARPGARLLANMNAGTIPDRGLYGVYLGGDGPRLGELDEEMVYESRKGDTFFLGASTWRVVDITRDRVVVQPAPGEPGRMPFWRGDGPGRPIELGRSMGAYVRRLGGMKESEAEAWLAEQSPLDAHARANLIGYVRDQREHTGVLPTDRAITLERFRDELGDWRVCLLSPFGSRVHAPWAMALERRLAAWAGSEVQTMYTDDGVVVRFADAEELPSTDAFLPAPDEVEDLVVEQVGQSALFAAVFRESAARALLLPRRRPPRRTALWQQRLRAQSLLAVVRSHPSFPILLETYRHCLQDVFDLPALVELLGAIRRREVRVEDVETPSPSPFARSLVFAYVANYLYEQDTPLAERKAQALTLDRDLLRELLGQSELRELLDAAVLDEVEAELQGLAEERQARSADELHDLLRRLGHLAVAELARRAREPVAGWLEQLERERRVVRLQVAGAECWVATEEAARYRDALGTALPPGLPDALLGAVPAPLEGLVRRYARSHGPFVTSQLAQRIGLLPSQVEPVLEQLEAQGQLARGEMRPGGVGLEWCDVEVLRRVKRRTLAKLRHQVAPVESAALGRFLPAWHGIDGPGRGAARLEEVVAQLEGTPLPWSTLQRDLLPSRIADFSLDMLDMLAAAGSVVWVGRGPLGARDGRVSLYRRERTPLLLAEPLPYEAETPLHEAILEHLESRGACFTVELERLVEAPSSHDLETALWDLVWAGQITNDTFLPLRTLGARRRRTRPGSWSPSRSGRGRGAGLAGGRWSRVVDLLDARASETERVVAQATALLERYGVLSREAAAAEEVPGGFSSLYRVLQEMEEAGRVRRGYFVEGLGGAQFAFAGAVERLRDMRDQEAIGGSALRVLPAVDPANPWGSLLPWPQGEGGETRRPRRMAGAWVVLSQGCPVLFLDAGSRRLLTFRTFGDEDEPEAIVGALATIPRRQRRRTLRVESIDGIAAQDSPHAPLFERCGFVREHRGLRLAQ